MKSRTYVRGLVMAMLIAVPVANNVSAAPGDGPVYTNASEADQAYSAARTKAQSADPRLVKAVHDADQASLHLAKMQGTGSAGQVRDAEQSLHNAEKMVGGMLSRMSGVSASDISAMRENGMSWSEVGRELGMNVGSSGMGQHGAAMSASGTGQGTSSGMGISADEMQMATMSSPVSGGVEGHGAGMKTGVQSGGNGQAMNGAGGLQSSMGSGAAQGNGMNMGGDNGSGGGGMGGDNGSGGGGMSGGSGSGGGGMGGGSGSGGGGMGGGMH